MTGTPPPPSPSPRLTVGSFEEAVRLELSLAELARFSDFVASEYCLLARRLTLEAVVGGHLKPLAPSDDGVPRFRVTGVPARLYPSIRRSLSGALIEIGGAEPVLATAGPLTELLTRRGRDTAAPTPTLLAALLRQGDAARLQAQLDAGLLLLWIPVRNSDQELRACRTLLKYSDRQVSTHDLMPLPHPGS